VNNSNKQSGQGSGSGQVEDKHTAGASGQIVHSNASVQQPGSTEPQVQQRSEVPHAQPNQKSGTVGSKETEGTSTLAGNNAGQKGYKKKEKAVDKVKCFRCDTYGHFSIECTVEICDFCESADHVSADCHLHKVPKPTLCMHGYGHEELFFFFLMRWS
jgi:hypothetical protein